MKKEIKNLLVVASIVVLVFVGSAVGMTDKQVIEERQPVVITPVEEQEDTDSVDQEPDNVDDTIVDNEPEPEEEFVPESLTCLVLGQDFVEGLTDVIMVVHFDAEKNDVKVVSIPRDYYINFREEPFKAIRQREENKGMPVDQKVTEIYYNLGQTKDALYTVKDVASLVVNMEIDYMAVIDTGGFRELVDIAGGVDFYVPRDMYWNDPHQDLLIDLEEGQQLLDGDKAEQLIRFRRYTFGDLDRMKVQQDFVEAFYKQVAANADLNQIIDLATAGYDLFDSDFGLSLALEYAEYIFKLNPEEVLSRDNMITLPWTDFINLHGREFVDWDMEDTHEAVYDLIYGEETE